MDPAAHSPFSLLPLRGSRRTGDASPAGTADLPSAVPALAGRPGPEKLQALRAAIQVLERPSLAVPGERAPQRDGRQAWRLGCAAADALVPSGLETDSLHEVKAAPALRGTAAGTWAAGLGFALRLAALRLAQTASAGRPGYLLWCWPRVLASELGRPCARGLAQLGIDPARLIIVETAREAEALLALEEGLKSGTLALALGVLEAAGLNPARRLSLAAAGRHTPCLIATQAASEGAAGCATRWRVSRGHSAPHPFDAKAPGRARFSIGLERCRSRPQSAALSPMLVEWCDETLRFGMAAGLAGHALGARRAGVSA